MVTIYATYDLRYLLCPELLAPIGILSRNRTTFEEKTLGHSLLLSESVYQAWYRSSPSTTHRTVLVSESLYKQYRTPGDRYVDQGSVLIAPGYQVALPLASDGRKDVTILGGSDLLQEAVRLRQSVDRMFLVQVHMNGSSGEIFPAPITEYFHLVDETEWPADENNPYGALFQTYWRK